MNALDILGSLVKAGMSQSGGDRLGKVLRQVLGGAMGGGAPGGMQAGGMQRSGAPGDGAGNLFDTFSKVAGAMLGGAPGQGGMPGMGGSSGGTTADILKQVAGAVLGGNAPGGNAAAGAGSMAVFGALAAQALQMAKTMMTGKPTTNLAPPQLDHHTAVIAGMQSPQTPHEHQQVMDVATLTLQAMLNAAKADGKLDADEQQRLLGKMQEDGVSEAQKQFIAAEMQRPIDLDALVRAVPNEQVAAQIYTASLMAITVDTDIERRYMADLAAGLKLDPNAVAFLHKTMAIT